MDVLGQVLNGLGMIVAGITYLLAQMVSGISNLMGLGLDPFGVGLWTGLAMASLVGFVVYRVRIWMKNWGNIYTSQKTMQSTTKTPGQVVSTGCGSMSLLLVCIAGLIAVAYLLGGL